MQRRFKTVVFLPDFRTRCQRHLIVLCYITKNRQFCVSCSVEWKGFPTNGSVTIMKREELQCVCYIGMFVFYSWWRRGDAVEILFKTRAQQRPQTDIKPNLMGLFSFSFGHGTSSLRRAI